MLITILMFIFPKFLSLIFGQICLHNLNFFNLTKISFDGYIAIYLLQFRYFFFQNSFHSYFLGKFSGKSWSSSNWLKFGTEVDCYMLISILMFSFTKFCHWYFLDKFGPKSWRSPNQLIFGTGEHCYMLIMVLMFSFSKLRHSYNFGQIWAKSNAPHID